MLVGMRGFMRALAGGAPGGHVVELPGVQASVIPSLPERSVMNCVLYEGPDRLERSLDTLADEYDRAGVRAWTVWVPHGEPAATEPLARAGHRFDGRPAAMALELDALAGEPDPGVRLVDAPSFAEVGRLNDVAYGFSGDFERGFAGLSTENFHVYLAEAGCSVVAFDHEGDCGIYLVATAPEARGRGLATALMTRALVDARERGCATSSLQATARGRPIYERLGFRDLGVIEMWERRGRD
jgi:GNAT superfamily N-acetyltransferase